MGGTSTTTIVCPFPGVVLGGLQTSTLSPINSSSNTLFTLKVLMAKRPHRRKSPSKNLRYPRHPKLPPQFVTDTFRWNNNKNNNNPPPLMTDHHPTSFDSNSPVLQNYDDPEEEEEEEEEEEADDDNKEEIEGGDNIAWDPDEIEAISSLFRGRIPQKPGMLYRERPLPLPLPHKMIRPMGFPSPKNNARLASSRQSLSKQVYKNPSFLIDLAKQIRSLPEEEVEEEEESVSKVLNKWSPFLRKGSLSLTIRELGHMGLPKRALHTFCWAQKQPHLFPDDRILVSTVEILARTHELKMPFNFKKFNTMASRSVIEAMVRGFIKGGSLDLAWKLLLVAKDGNRLLDSSIYAKLILALGKNPDKQRLVMTLLEELGEREDLNLNQQDCTAIMKVCIKLGKFEIVECLFNWFKQSGHEPGVVMYTTLIHSRCSEKKHREALALVWEMEGSNCLFDLPAYRVVIKLFVALNDLSRAVRYFSKLKEAGFSPTYDIYKNLFTIYMASGRVAKCKEVCKEAEMAGFVLDKHIRSQLLKLQG